jgi:hypothetical protein
MKLKKGSDAPLAITCHEHVTSSLSKERVFFVPTSPSRDKVPR